MLTPGRKSRRSILTPSRTSSRVSSPAPSVEKAQIISETSQYKLQTVPLSIHSIARDVLKRPRVKLAGLTPTLGYVADGNRVVVWYIGGSKMFELLLPNNVFSVHITADNGAVVSTVMGEVVRWSRVDQTQRYTVQHNTITQGVVDVVLHHDNNTLLLLDAAHNVWVSDNTSLTQLNPSSALGGISRRVSSMFWTAPETQLGDANKIVSCNDVIFVVGTKGVQRIHGTAVTWTVELKPLISSSCSHVNIIDAVSVDSALKCLVEVDGLLCIVTLSANHTAIPCSVDNSIQLQTGDMRKVKLLLSPGGSEVGLLYSETECLVVTLTSGVSVPVTLEGGEVLCATNSPAGDFQLVTRQHGMVRLIVKDVKAAVSNLNISASDDDEFKPVEKKFLGAFKCFIEFNETVEQAKLQDILGTTDESLINRIISETAEYLISSAPAADPRWGGADVSLPVTLGLQIDERIRRLKGLLEFVVSTGYFETLTTSALALTILQYVEKCLVAKSFCASGCSLLRRAINESAALFKSGNTSVSSEDLVFSKIRQVEVVYEALATGQNSVLSTKSEEESVIQDLFASVEVIQQSFDAVLSWRQESSQLYQSALKSGSLTWCDTDDIRTMLAAQVHIAVDTVLPDVDDEGRYQVLVVAASLVESVLTLYKDIIGRLPENDNRSATLQAEFERRRHALIQPFVDLKIYQIAFTLAEQFQYFSLLVEMCEDTNDMVKLRTLSGVHPGFAEVAYNWYLSKGKQSRLLTANVAEPQQLSTFLTSQPHLKWIHQLGNKDYATAGDTLAKLGVDEKDSLSRKKTLLSISKLSYLADGQPPDTDAIRALNRHLETVTQQERMKPEVIENAGLLAETMAPISSAELIRLCISEHNNTLEDIDVKKCLDLLKSVAEDEAVSNETFETLRLEVWTAVIRRDDWWRKCGHATPEQINQSLFYQSVILALSFGLLVSHFLPSVEELLGAQVWQQHFPEEAQFKQFEYILRSGYEQMSRLGVVAL